MAPITAGISLLRLTAPAVHHGYISTGVETFQWYWVCRDGASRSRRRGRSFLPGCPWPPSPRAPALSASVAARCSIWLSSSRRGRRQGKLPRCRQVALQRMHHFRAGCCDRWRPEAEEQSDFTIQLHQELSCSPVTYYKGACEW